MRLAPFLPSLIAVFTVAAYIIDRTLDIVFVNLPDNVRLMISVVSAGCLFIAVMYSEKSSQASSAQEAKEREAAREREIQSLAKNYYELMQANSEEVERHTNAYLQMLRNQTSNPAQARCCVYRIYPDTGIALFWSGTNNDYSHLEKTHIPNGIDSPVIGAWNNKGPVVKDYSSYSRDSEIFGEYNNDYSTRYVVTSEWSRGSIVAEPFSVQINENTLTLVLVIESKQSLQTAGLDSDQMRESRRIVTATLATAKFMQPPRAD